MSLEQQIVDLTTATTDLLDAVNVRKSVLDERVETAGDFANAAQMSANAAAASVTDANQAAGEAAGSAAQALAIYGTAAAQQSAVIAAQTAASLAEGYAAAASSVAQQDLSGVTAAALHRSPNAVTAMFVYDTSKDSDGGAWTEKCRHTSWYNETINGKWLGAQASEAAARAVSGAATGDYFQLTTDGKFYRLNAGSGITEVFRGNKRDFPRLAGIVAEASNVTIYDLTEPGRPMFARFLNTAGHACEGNNSSLAAQNGLLVVGSSTGEYEISFAKDSSAKRNVTSYYTRSGNLAGRNAVASWVDVGAAYKIANSTVYAVAMTALPDAPVDPVTGLKVPTIAVATAIGVSVSKQDGSVKNLNIAANYNVDLAFNGRTLYVAGVPGTNRGIFSTTDVNGATILVKNYFATFGLPQFDMTGANEASQFEYAPAIKTLASRPENGGFRFLREHYSNGARSVTARIQNTFNTGWKIGDTKRVYLSDIDAGSVTGPELVSDRSYKASSASILGALTKSAVASNTQLVGYSGFSASNYLREPYSADLDFGTGEWSVGAWVKVPAANATAATIACREHSAGAHIRLGIDATSKLTATAFDGATTRTVTTSGTYNTDTWVKPEAIYAPDGALAIRVNGVEVAKTTGAPLLTLSNPDAVLTIGNSYALDAPFPGSIALLKLSATVPTAEQSVWMYEQEKQLFREGAQCCLPDSGTIVDLAYDDATDKWIAASANNISEWSGLVRTNVTPVPAGSYTKAAAASGVQLLARSTTNPGVDITIPAYGLREELVKRAEAAAQRSKETITFDFDVTAGQTEFALPVGYVTKAVYVDGAAKRQGSTKDYTLLFDGFKETVKFAVAPATAAWVQIHAIKE